MSLTQLNLEQRFVQIFADLFNRQTSTCIAILGRRESGKTDFALLIAEILASLGIIQHFASNIRIYSAPFEITRTTNLQDLELWSQSNQGKKLFILDEAGKSLRRRTPMSRLNIKIIDDLQILRKYKLSIIFIAPDAKYIDSVALGSDIIDAVFQKYRSKKVALYRDELENTTLTLNNIPATSVNFDTWDVAPFKLQSEVAKPQFKDMDLNNLWDLTHGKTIKELGLHNEQVARLWRKFVKEVLERQSHESQ